MEDDKVTPPTPPAEPQKPAEPAKPAVKSAEELRYEASVKAMNASQREAAELRKSVDLMKSELAKVTANIPQGQEPTQEQKDLLEKKYGMSYGTLAAMNDLLDVKTKKFNDIEGKINALGESIAETRYETFKGNLKASDKVIAKYEDEFDEELNALPPSQRLNKQTVESVKQRIVAKHFDEIMEEVRAEERAKINPAQPQTPDVGSVSGGGASIPSTPKSKLTAEQVEIAKRSGMDVQALEDYVSGKPAKQVSGWASHRN